MNAKHENKQIRIRTIEELLSAIPGLIGFHPRESLVAVVTRDEILKLTCRMDFPAGGSAPAADLLRQVWGRFPGSGGFVVAFTQRHDPWPVLEELTTGLPADPLWVVHVGRETWRRDCATGPSGSYRPASESTSRKLPASREELAKSILPEAEETELQEIYAEQRRRLQQVPDPQWGPRMRDLLDSFTADRVLAPAGCAQAAVLLGDSHARDIAVTYITRETSGRMLQLWLSVVRRCPESHLVHPLSLLSLAAWVAGRGALANIARERAEELLGLSYARVVSGYPTPDPEVPALIGMLGWFHYHMMEPACWEEVRSKALAQIA